MDGWIDGGREEEREGGRERERARGRESETSEVGRVRGGGFVGGGVPPEAVAVLRSVVCVSVCTVALVKQVNRVVN